MLKYTFSRREKALLLGLAIVLVAVAWFMLVFQRTTDQITKLDSEIAEVDSSVTIASAQVNRMNMMQTAIDKYKSEGIAPRPVPSFDNMTALMSELNSIMAATENYSLSFDALDTETSKEYVLRGVTIDFSCDTVASAEAVITALAKGAFPCSIDSVAINDNSVKTSTRTSSKTGTAPVVASVHVTFFEKPVTKTSK